MDWAKTTARRDEKHLSFGIWCDLYQRFYGSKQGGYRNRKWKHPVGVYRKDNTRIVLGLPDTVISQEINNKYLTCTNGDVAE